MSFLWLAGCSARPDSDPSHTAAESERFLAAGADGGAILGKDRGATFYGIVVRAGRAVERKQYEVAMALLDGIRLTTADSDSDVAEIKLLRAQIAADRQNYEEAIRMYHELTDILPEYEPKRIRKLSEVLAAAGRVDEAVSMLDSIINTGDISTDRTKAELFEKKAEWLAEAGNHAGSVAAFEAAQSLTGTTRGKERLALKTAQILLAMQKKEAAREILLPLALKASSARNMTRARHTLEKANLGPSWSPEEKIERARTLVGFRAWKAAENTLRGLDKSRLKSVREEAAFLSAKVLFQKRRHYKEALAALGPIAKQGGDYGDEARFLMARALSRLDRDEKAIEAYRSYARDTSRVAKAQEARFLAGRLAFYLGRHDEALRTMEALVGPGKKKRPKKPIQNGSLRRDAHYIAGMASLLGNKPTRAMAHLEAADRGSNNADVLARNAYWAAVAKTRKDPKSGASALRKVCEDDPSSWYALLSEERLRDLKENRDPCHLPKIPSAPPSSDRMPVNALSELAAFYARAGLFREAASELRRVERSGAKDVEAAVWIHHYVALDAPHFAIRMAIRGLDWPPKPADRWLADCAYPTPYADWVDEVENQHKLPDGLIHAIARKESLFDPNAVSRVGAMGMMQMMPRTYEANRKRAGLPPLRDGELPAPEPSIRAAGYEFAALFEQFGSLPLAIMAYNAGPAAVSRWLDRSGGLPMDVFVEKAGFAQTRNYVKRVYKNLVRYRLLQGKEPPAIPPTAVRPDIQEKPDVLSNSK